MAYSKHAGSIDSARRQALPLHARRSQVAVETVPVPVQVSAVVENPVSSALFGHFLERPSWGGETGPEAAYPAGAEDLPAPVLALLEDLDIPLIRFPYGADGDHTDWTALIDAAPTRGGTARPGQIVGKHGDAITTRFGFDEYFRLQQRLGCDTILVVNLLDGLAKRRPLPEAALHAAGLIAYANAAVGAPLPAGMPDWPAVRVANGHPDPIGAHYVQIGNEWWHPGFRSLVTEAVGDIDKAELDRWYLAVLHAYIAAIRAVDPAIGIIIDAEMGGPEEAVLSDPVIRQECQLVALHHYAPWSMDQAPLTAPSDEIWWGFLVERPSSFGDDGQSIGLAIKPHFIERGYRIACTEWNWNGWFKNKEVPRPAFDILQVAGIGAAGFLNGLMRQGDVVALATQSMLLGERWGITAVRVRPDGPPYLLPQAIVAGLWARHHGDRRLRCTVADQRRIPSAREGQVVDGVAPLDIVATADAATVYLHCVNRSWDQATALTITFDGLEPEAEGSYTFFQAETVRRPHDVATPFPATEQRPVRLPGLVLPPRSAGVATFPLQPAERDGSG